MCDLISLGINNK